jgi:hypothetical protein
MMADYWMKLIGHVAVDSGQLMLCDPCYIKSQDWEDGPFERAQPNTSGYYPFNYNGVCGATLSDSQAGSMAFESGFEGVAVAFSSGFGDGFYPVYATYVDDPDFGRRIAKVEVVMIDIDEEEE